MENKDGNGGAKSVPGGAKLPNDPQELLHEQSPNCDNTNRSNSGNEEQIEEGHGEDEEEDQAEEEAQRPSSPVRTPFTNLSQIDADLALARTLQEQERAYMMLRMNAEGSDYGSWEEASYEDEDFGDPHDVDHDADDDDDDDDEEDDGNDELEHDESEGEDDRDAFDVHADAEVAEEDQTTLELDPAAFSSDEAYARALQDAEERDMAARLFALAGINDRRNQDAEERDLAARLFALAGINDRRIIGMEYHGTNHQDAWDEVDPDELSYEELIALGEVVGTESRGLSADTIASLPSIEYKAGSSQNGSNESCVICRLDYEEDETLTALSCKHTYHPECINNWLKINKACPVCSAEVSTSGHS